MSGSWFLRTGRLRWLLAGLLLAAAPVVNRALNAAR